MDRNAQRIAIAEACGWKKVHWYSDNAGPDILSGDPPPTYKKRHKYDSAVPDYLDDLNAMHQVEMVLNREERRTYCAYLCASINEQATWMDWWSDITDTDKLDAVFAAANATAAQRAEAFLKTIGKWSQSQ